MALPCFGLTRMVNSLFTSLPFKTPHVGVILVTWGGGGGCHPVLVSSCQSFLSVLAI